MLATLPEWRDYLNAGEGFLMESQKVRFHRVRAL